ncbi:hypothetical protein DNU06_00925 [Putridiphycobacter roseus]|uniref:Cysteine-rich CWC family protein n=1 Tax=Putridiphycobacter roseus TaxID=2219161 RepID=A0A2W1NUJ0_9FLAO|nr:hypothetical protein DNU06_00925 [Putridiphycobacter roseus]
MLKNCAKCDQSFECKASNIDACHCNTIKLNKWQLNYIHEKYNNCLCNACLKEMLQIGPVQVV